MAGNTGTWVLGAIMGLLALVALTLAGGAKDPVLYGTGLGVFGFCVLFIFVLIHRNVGR